MALLLSQGRRRLWLWVATLLLLAALVWALGRSLARRPARPELGVGTESTQPVEPHRQGAHGSQIAAPADSSSPADVSSPNAEPAEEAGGDVPAREAAPTP